MPYAYRAKDANRAGEPREETAIAEVRGMVADIVPTHRELGVRRATSVAAEMLCIGIRRARGYYHGEIRAVPDGELRQCREAFLAYLRQRRMSLADEAAMLDDHIARMSA